MQKVEKIIIELSKKYTDFTFYSPIHNTGFMYELLDYDLGMKHCITFLDKSDEIWFFGDWQKSRGCEREYNHAVIKKIPIKDFNQIYGREIAE